MIIYPGRDGFNSTTWVPIPVEPLPTIVPIFPPSPISLEPGSCPKCGLKLYPVMGYYCGTVDCPTGLGSRQAEPSIQNNCYTS